MVWVVGVSCRSISGLLVCFLFRVVALGSLLGYFGGFSVPYFTCSSLFFHRNWLVLGAFCSYLVAVSRSEHSGSQRVLSLLVYSTPFLLFFCSAWQARLM